MSYKNVSRNSMKRFLLLSALIFNCISFCQDSPTFDLKMLRYKFGSGNVSFILSVNNPSTDTIVLLKPESRYFRQHYANRVKKVVGINDYPYSIQMTQSDTCEAPFQDERPVGDITGHEPVNSKLLIKIAPNSTSVLGKVTLDCWPWFFCRKSTYSFTVKYKVKPKSLDPKTEKIILTKMKEINEQLSAMKDILSETELKYVHISSGLSMLEMQLESIKNSKMLYTEEIVSEPSTGTGM